MKGRSHRFPEPHEDWGDGSWTVDCVCGVNFDDGEEMVNCDECGVWVHTRCSRYVKGDEVFACDKCKRKNNRHDSEEKEVAQLLVELPTKTLGLENSCAANVPARRPFRLWTEIPMEERVHVQGVPGGDPSIFGSSSSIFSRELWKCTGYVPKKFNFQYKEFPCWEEDEKGEVNNTRENGHETENGPGVLFSLSKENVLDAPTTSPVHVRGKEDDLTFNSKLEMKDDKTQESGVKLKRSESGMEKEKSLVSGVSHSNKRRKDESGSSKERTKKKFKASNSEEEGKKGISHSSNRTIDDHRDRESASLKDGTQSIGADKSNGTIFRETVNGNLTVDNGCYQTSNTLEAAACSENVPKSDGYGLEQPDDRAGNQVRIVFKTSATNSTPSPERKDAGDNHVRGESEAKTRVDTSDPNAEGSFESAVKPNDGGGTDSTAQDFEAAGSLLTVSQSQAKQSCSGTPQRGDKANQPNSNSLSKHSPHATHPPLAPNTSATLSDEELALLLHQELNSSPRVPRIPRVRQPGSLQLASPAATSLLIKRTSTSGGKDNISVSRKKSKDLFRDGFRSRDGDERTLKNSNGRRAQDTGDRGGGSTKGEEKEPPRIVLSARKLLPPSSTTSTSSGPCSSNEVNDHSVASPQTSSRIASDDVPVAHRTLPGLINEIMSKGKRMTYEELCNAVLPHWPHLRKHNGERYAYSSHSQAVLDCLRNRHEWARLVDRGPKTNSGRKKRKNEAEDSEDDESSKGLENGSGKSVECQKEDFPKGKRKARKRRRLALQGRGLKDIRKIRKAEISHKDDGPYSDSSEESMFSEDEDVHGSSRLSNVRGETSASSDENGTR